MNRKQRRAEKSNNRRNSLPATLFGLPVIMDGKQPSQADLDAQVKEAYPNPPDIPVRKTLNSDGTYTIRWGIWA